MSACACIPSNSPLVELESKILTRTAVSKQQMDRKYVFTGETSFSLPKSANDNLSQADDWASPGE